MMYYDVSREGIQDKSRTRAGQVQYFRDCPTSFGTVGNYELHYWVSMHMHQRRYEMLVQKCCVITLSPHTLVNFNSDFQG